MMYIGIDPGFTGAVAFYSPKDAWIDIHDMPTVTNPKGKTILDLYALHALFDVSTYGTLSGQVVAVLEHVAARPGQGAPATFRFGQGYGALEMGLASHKHPTRYVTPAVWKKHFGLSKDKGASRGLAQQRFPQLAYLFSRVKDDGRAEAALIALYGHEVLK